jgi:putative ATPase
MHDLFGQPTTQYTNSRSKITLQATGQHLAENTPLAERIRPRNIDEIVGQQHLLAPGKLLHRLAQTGKITSLILYGPPGTGKTTLARILATQAGWHCQELNAVETTVSQVRTVIEEAKNRLAANGRGTVIFLDEIHRFNKAQQDVLLPHVERGIVRLIGATTLNPFFYVNPPLVSRSQIFQLEPLTPDDVKKILQRAMAEPHRGLGHLPIRCNDAALDTLARLCCGDVRQALNALELAAHTTPPDADGHITLTEDIFRKCLPKRPLHYDADGDAHYDTISAFIKSMRGGDPDATLLWLAKMLHAGEDPAFIARRIIICAAEDVGLADPHALVLATSAAQALERIGLPEGRIILSQAALYVARAPKSNSAYTGIDTALQYVRNGGNTRVPDHLRDASYPGAEKLGHHGYIYPHDHPDKAASQKYTPEPVKFFHMKITTPKS